MNQIEKEFEFIRKVYRDILNGYTSFKLKNDFLYFKHLTDLEQTECNSVFVKEFNKAIASGLLEEKEKIKILKDNGHWTQEREDKIKKIQSELQTLETTKSKLIIKSQIDSINKSITKLSEELKDILKERTLLLDLTAEEFAKKKSNEYILYITIYRDAGLKNKFFRNLEEFEAVESEELLKFFIIYKEILEQFSYNNIRKISVLPFFLNYYFLSKNNPYYFYGKPIVFLTKYQLELFTLGKQSENVLIQSKSTPPSNYETLDELINWYNNQTLINSNLDRNKNDKLGNTYLGATKEEIKKIVGNDKETLDLLQEAEKVGKDLDFKDLLKIHGEI